MNSPFVDERYFFNMFKDFALASGFRQLKGNRRKASSALKKALEEMPANCQHLPLSSIKHKINDIVMMNCK